jgi:hypothetical protein
MLIKKIFILINSEREFDYYNNLVNKYPDKFSFIINDHKKQANYFSFKKKKYYNSIKLSSILNSNKKNKVEVLISTGLGHLQLITIKSFLKFIYSRIFGNLILTTKLENFFLIVFKRKFTAGANKCPIFDSIQIEKKISKLAICFPRGLDLNIKMHPEKRWIKTFDYFFCHSKFDKKIIEKNTSKKAFLIGYPRYKNKKNQRNRIRNILWMPSYPKYSNDKMFNIKKWLTVFSKLNTKKYKITIKFHPKIFLNNKSKLIFQKHINVVDDPNQSLDKLYSQSDLVICDYGGSIFSALYNEKPIILLNTDINKYGLNKDNLEIVLRKNFYELKNLNEQKLIKLIEDINKNYLYNKLLIRNLKKKIFGENVPLQEVYKKIIKLSNEANYI